MADEREAVESERARAARVEALICITRDVTERKRTEAQIRGQLEELQRWREVTLAAEAAVRKSEDLNRGVLDSMLAQLQATARPAPAAAEEPASDILELTEQMAAPPEEPAFRTIDGQQDVVFEDRPPAPFAPPAPRPVEQLRRAAIDEGSLISAATSAAVDSAFNTLAQTVLVQNGRTLEDLVREMLRPLLKTWLDDNLPSMVERLVRAEIERVSRGRG